MAWKIALFYGLVGGAWVLGSGWALHLLVVDTQLEATIEQLKGALFVLVTAGLLGWILTQYFRQIREDALRLQASEERWQFALEGSGNGVWDWNAQTNEVFYSPRWKAMLGYEPSEISGDLSEWETRVHPDDLERVQLALRDHLEGRTPTYSCEHRLRCKDGSYRWTADQGKIISRTADGRPLRILGTQMDITERKKAERLQVLSAEILTILNDIQTFPDAVQRILGAIKRETNLDAVGIRLREGDDFPYAASEGFPDGFLQAENSVLSTSPSGASAAQDSSRLQLECYCGLVLSGQTDPADPIFTPGGSAWTNHALDFQAAAKLPCFHQPPRNRCVHEGFQSMALIPIRVNAEIVGLLQLNDRRPGAFSLEMIHFLEGIAASFGVALLRQREEQALRESEANWRSYVELAPVGVLVADAQGQHTAANRTAEEILGYEPGGLLHTRVIDLPAEEMAETARQHLAKIHERGQADVECLLRRKDGRRIWASIRGTQLPGGRFMAVIQDITDRLRAQEAVRRWADAFEHCAHGIAMGVPGTNHIFACNPAFAGMVGRSVEDLVGAPILSLSLSADRQWVEERIAEADVTGQVQYESRLVRQDGSSFPVQMDVVSVRDAEGRALYRVVTAQDITARQKAEAEVQQRLQLQDQISQIATTVPGLIYSFRQRPDGAGSLSYATPAIEALCGLTAEEACADFSRVLARFHPDDLAPFQTSVETSARTMQPWRLAFRICHPLKGLLWVEGQSIPRREPDGSILWHGYMLDVTERKRTETALEQSEERFRRVVESAPEAIFIRTQEQFTYVNAAALRLFGAEQPEQLVGHPVIDRFHPDCRAQVLERMRLMEAESDRILAVDRVILKLDGAEVPVLISAAPFYFQNQQCALVFAHDITIRTRAEQEVKRQTGLVRSLLDSIPDLIFYKDRHGEYLGCNPSFAEFVGRARHEITGRTDHDLFPASVADGFREFDQQMLVSLNSRHNEEWVTYPDGRRVLLDTLKTPYWGPDGNLIGVLGISRDITARKRIEEALRISEARHRLIFESTHDAIMVVIPPSLQFVRANPAALKAFGVDTEAAFCRLSPIDLSPPHQPDGTISADGAAHVAQLALAQGSHTFEWQHQRRSGETFPALVSLTRAEFDGQILLQATIRDITEQKRAEEELRRRLELQNQMAHIAATVPGVIYSFQLRTDGTACFPYASAELGKLFGVKMLDVQRDAASLMSRIHPADIGWVQESIFTSARTLGTWRAEFRILPPQGEMWVEAHSVPQREADGSVLWHGFLHDVTERKNAERRLRQLSRAVEQSPAIIVITNTQGVIEYANPKFTQTTGYTLEEVLGKNPRVLKSGTMTPETYQILWKTILDGREWRGEFHNRKKNGELYWEYASISAIADAAGKVTHFIAVKEDITERKRLESLRQALLSLSTQLNSARAHLTAGRALFAAAEQLWKWDSATLDILSADTDQVQPVLRVDTVEGERRELPVDGTFMEPTSRMRRVTQHGAELILREPDANSNTDSTQFGDLARLSASIMCVPIRREAQTVGILSIQSYRPLAYTDDDLNTLQALADYCGVALDRIQTEEALHSSEERYRGLVETTFDWIWELNAEGRYIYASPKVQDLLGYRPEEVLGHTPFDLMPEEEARRVGEIFMGIVGKRQPFSALENTNRHKDGRLVVLESSGVPVLAPDGTLLGYRGMDRDVTERKRLEAQLRQAQKLEAIGQLAGGVAHDFNNILAAIMLNLSLLQMNESLDQDTKEALKDLDGEARRAASLTRQLLMFSRRSVLAVRPLDLNDVVGNLLKMLNRLIGEHIILSFEGGDALPPVAADAGMVEQVLMNLVVNARDAMPKGGQIAITTHAAEFGPPDPGGDPNRQPGRFVCLAVADNGSGMDATTLKRIFEPFFTTKEAGKGTGLGLATVHGIVAQHKGWVEVESQLGAGTSFRVYLPAVASAPMEKGQPTDTEFLRQGKETILLVEDEPKVRRLAGGVLRQLGYRVYEAANGQQALILWRMHGPEINLLLTDMVMPEGLNGLELTERLQELKPGLKVIISSGYSAEIAQAGVPNRPGIDYLPKPYEAKTLAAAVRICLDRNVS